MASRRVELFFSLQSPYCYFVIDRALALDRRDDVNVVLRPVLPAVLRIPASYRDRSELEQAYFLLDVQRTADFLGLPYAEPEPSPVVFETGSLWRATEEQPRIWHLLDLMMAATNQGQGLVFAASVMRLIWDGQTRDWHRDDHLRKALEGAGLDLAALERTSESQHETFRQQLAENHDALIGAGHWGVPTMAVNGEAFYGQDRFDQLLWRLGLAAEDLEPRARLNELQQTHVS